MTGSQRADTINGFLDGRRKTRRRFARKALSKQYRFSGGKVMSVRERIESLHAADDLYVGN